MEGRDHQWKALFTQLSDVPRDMNVAAVLEVVVDSPAGRHPVVGDDANFHLAPVGEGF